MNDENERSVASTGSVDILTRLADHHAVTMWDVDEAAAEIARLRLAVAASKASAQRDDILTQFHNCGVVCLGPDGTDWPAGEIKNSVVAEIEYLQNEIARLRLTDAEREAVAYAEDRMDGGPVKATLRGLLERLK